MASVDKSFPRPVSPSKRHRAASHYSNLESSPSKRRVSTFRKDILEHDERKLLFTERTNNGPLVGPTAVEEAFGLSMQNPDIVKPKTRANTTAGRVKLNPPRTRSRVDHRKEV